MAKQNKAQTDYDSPWKDVLELFFPQFMLFFFPQAHQQIDWTRPHIFLDKEFQKVTREARTGKRYVDKLVQVYLLEGVETWILIHVEVQGTPEDSFAERMFIYHYRIYDHYRQQVVSLAILTDDQAAWRPNHFGYERFGCRQSLDFPVVKLLDYQNRVAELANDPNPFAVVVLAHLQTQVTQRKTAERYAAKLSLARLLYHRGFGRREVLELFRFIDWVMTLPAELEAQFKTDIAQLEAEVNMRYITSIERLAREEGMQQGMQQGVQQGVDVMRRNVTELLYIRLGVPLTQFQTQLNQVNDLDRLSLLVRWAATVTDVAQFEQKLTEGYS